MKMGSLWRVMKTLGTKYILNKLCMSILLLTVLCLGTFSFSTCSYSVKEGNIDIIQYVVNEREAHDVEKPTNYTQHDEPLFAVNQTRVLLLAYYRSGSSFVGDFFRKNKEVFYNFEPDRALDVHIYGGSMFRWHTNSSIINQMKEEMALLITKTLQCRFNHLPAEYFLDEFRYTRSIAKSNKYVRCIGGTITHKMYTQCNDLIRDMCKNGDIDCLIRLNETRRCAATPGCIKKKLLEHPDDKYYKRHECIYKLHTTTVSPCTHILEEQCKNANIVVAKTIKLSVRQAETMMSNDPYVKIIYLVRDPRAILASRLQIHNNIRENFHNRLRSLCMEMLDDVEKGALLHHLYPDRFMELPYELAAEKPALTKRLLYNFLGKAVPSEVNLPLSDGKKMDGGTYGTVRNNTRESIYKWTSTFNDTELTDITSISHCNKLITLLGYE